MSLDFYLHSQHPSRSSDSVARVFVRREGRTQEVEDWDERDGWVHVKMPRDELFWANVTHNLVPMAKEADLYAILWRGGGKRAEEIVPTLQRGLERLRAEPERFRKLNPPNGWGSYEVFLAFVEEVLEACQRWPEAVVKVSV